MKSSTPMLIAALLLAAPTASLQAQDTTAAPPAAPERMAPDVDRDRLQVFLTVYEDVARVATDFGQELARVFESQRRAEIREHMDDSIAAVYERHAMSKEEFERITFLVSADSAHRAAFDSMRQERSGRPPEG